MAETGPVLIFDFDGVIADTEPLHWRSWVSMLSRYGGELSWEEYCEIGRGVDDVHLYEILRTRSIFSGGLEFPVENAKRKQLVREWSLAEIPIAAETIAMLKALRGRIGLVTSSERAEVEPVLRAAEIYDVFDAMVFGEDVALRKPSPAPYQLAAKKLGIKSGVVFEDSEAGLASARAAGLTAVKVEHPNDLAGLVARYCSGV